jgi:hypothetical protein
MIPARRHRRPQNLRWMGAVALAGLAVGAVLLFGPAWQQKRSAEDRAAQTEAMAQQALADYSKGLPKPYAPGLTLVAVRLEGPALVSIIRSAKRNAASDRANPQMMEIARQAEQAELLTHCRNPDVLRMLSQGLVLTRRFVDAGNDVFFEVSLSGQDCLSGR